MENNLINTSEIKEILKNITSKFPKDCDIKSILLKEVLEYNYNSIDFITLELNKINNLKEIKSLLNFSTIENILSESSTSEESYNLSTLLFFIYLLENVKN